MEKKKRELNGAGELRRKAEERLKAQKPASPAKLSELKTQELIQELQVHQIELEMQNEELRKTQTVVEESRAKYSDLYDFAPVGYLTLNRRGLILEANLTLCSKLGIERSLLISINNLFTNFIIKKEEKDLFYKYLGKVFEAKSPETCELELKGKGNSKFYAQLESIVVGDNSSQCRTAMTDITERKKTEQAIKDTAYQFQTVVESVGEGITFSDNSGKFLVYNLRMQEITGFTQDEANNSGDFTRLLYPGPLERQKALQRLQEIVEHKVALPLEVEATIQAKDGTKKVLWISTRAMRFKDQEMFLSIYRDITERKKVEQALQEAVKAKSAFTSMVSHELRTPLGALKESVSQVLEGLLGTLTDDQRKFLGIAKRNVDRLARLITEVLDFQTLETGKMVFKMQDNDINEVVKETKETMDIIAKEKGLDFVLNLDKKLPKTKFDRDKISQVLSNVVNNSLKLTEKGSITISTTKGNNVIQVSVKDTGPGIKEEDIPRLFQQYEQLERKTGGTGLGLAISLEIIKTHGGKIWAESIFGQGTTMHFLLPIEERRRRT
jgi:PAS domain S-box-containing protein